MISSAIYKFPHQFSIEYLHKILVWRWRDLCTRANIWKIIYFIMNWSTGLKPFCSLLNCKCRSTHNLNVPHYMRRLSGGCCCTLQHPTVLLLLENRFGRAWQLNGMRRWASESLLGQALECREQLIKVGSVIGLERPAHHENVFDVARSLQVG